MINDHSRETITMKGEATVTARGGQAASDILVPSALMSEKRARWMLSDDALQVWKRTKSFVAKNPPPAGRSRAAYHRRAFRAIEGLVGTDEPLSDKRIIEAM